MKRLGWIITLPLGVLFVLFAVSNRTEVTVSLWPADIVPVPLYLLALGGLLVGFLAGATVAGVASLRWRRRARREARRAAALESELARLKRQPDSLPAPANVDRPQQRRLSASG